MISPSAPGGVAFTSASICVYAFSPVSFSIFFLRFTKRVPEPLCNHSSCAVRLIHVFARNAAAQSRHIPFLNRRSAHQWWQLSQEPIPCFPKRFPGLHISCSDRPASLIECAYIDHRIPIQSIFFRRFLCKFFQFLFRVPRFPEDILFLSRRNPASPASSICL